MPIVAGLAALGGFTGDLAQNSISPLLPPNGYMKQRELIPFGTYSPRFASRILYLMMEIPSRLQTRKEAPRVARSEDPNMSTQELPICPPMDTSDAPSLYRYIGLINTRWAKTSVFLTDIP